MVSPGWGPVFCTQLRFRSIQQGWSTSSSDVSARSAFRASPNLHLPRCLSWPTVDGKKLGRYDLWLQYRHIIDVHIEIYRSAGYSYKWHLILSDLCLFPDCGSVRTLQVANISRKTADQIRLTEPGFPAGIWNGKKSTKDLWFDQSSLGGPGHSTCQKRMKTCAKLHWTWDPILKKVMARRRKETQLRLCPILTILEQQILSHTQNHPLLQENLQTRQWLKKIRTVTNDFLMVVENCNHHLTGKWFWKFHLLSCPQAHIWAQQLALPPRQTVQQTAKSTQKFNKIFSPKNN